MNYLRYISRPGTETNNKLVALTARMQELDSIANDFRKAQGWGPFVLTRGSCVAGGLFGIHFPEQPKDWRDIGLYGDEGEEKRFYWPIKGRKSTRDLLPQLEALPKMHNREFNQAIGANTVWSHYGIQKGPEGSFLLTISESFEYTATDLEEITSKHYNELVAQVQAVAVTDEDE